MVATNNATLLTDRGARRVTVDQLAGIQAPQPTDTWFPISHHRVFDLTCSTLEDSGFHVRRIDLAVSQDNHKFFGVLDLVSDIVDGVKLAIGIRNSTDKSLPAGIAIGDRVLVCSNLSFSAQIVIMRKHTRRIEDELPGRVQAGISRLRAFQEASAARIEKFKCLPVSDPQAHDLVVRAVDNKCIGLRDLPKVLNEWREPSHEEFQPRTAWSLHNAFTEVAKDRFSRQPAATAGQTIRLNRLFAGMVN